jgi:AdoMet-dependent heme synthase
MLSSLKPSSKAIPFPKQANFLITGKCNANCYFCLNDWREEKTDFSDELSYEEKKAVIDEFASKGVNFLVITGGEPLMDPNLAKILAHAKKNGIDCILQTNGMLLTKEMLVKIAPYLLGIQVSLEGMEKSHNDVTRGGNFKKTVKGIKNALSSGLIVQVNTTMTQFNRDDMIEFVPFLKKLGISRLNLIRLYMAGNALRHQDKIFLSQQEMKAMVESARIAAHASKIELQLQGAPLVEKNDGITGISDCGAGSDELAINYNGEVMPCPSWNRSFGNVRTHTLDDIWKGEHMTRVRDVKKSCSTCPLSTGTCSTSQKNSLDVRNLVGGEKIFKKILV